MTPRNRFPFLAALAASAVASIAGAAPLEPKHLPADTKWVIHVDMDAARDTKTYDTVSSAVFANPRARDGIDKIEALTDARFPEDLKDVTVYGAAAGDEAGVIVIHAKIDRGRMENLVKQNPSYSSTAYGNYSVLTWDDNGKTSYGAFHDDGTIIIAKSSANVQAALDAMDDKGDRLKPEDAMVAGSKAGQMLYVGARDLKSLRGGQGENTPIAAVKVGWVALSEDKKNPLVTAQLTAEDADSAKKLKGGIDGLKALLGMVSGGEDADPVAKAASAAIADYDSKQTDAVVDITIPVPAEKFSTLVDAVMKKRAGK